MLMVMQAMELLGNDARSTGGQEVDEAADASIEQQLWTLTWPRMDQWYPRLKEELFPPPPPPSDTAKEAESETAPANKETAEAETTAPVNDDGDGEADNHGTVVTEEEQEVTTTTTTAIEPAKDKKD
ncbi:hypothetical protein SYNPS1DRAFT_27107 [Syncephalis pseudoplumigaleata]|uniref:Uncharacterized protein n=1 Tax=Syncephalis pseudoplumigaleata TaxID=1712513 RepID=A0A4P9Z484_9FUNG|nr:hypothetical protein SYNPS1DRAFT_27107 [Syncephalis pseudoplumigaleata]|eukprot:RKP27228.1 hypothetical protein SYNPS1DRAFT_27107 [Syncephalis pseudoplumigaleata]